MDLWMWGVGGHCVHFWDELWSSVMLPTELPSLEIGGPLEHLALFHFTGEQSKTQKGTVRGACLKSLAGGIRLGLG